MTLDCTGHVASRCELNSIFCETEVELVKVVEKGLLWNGGSDVEIPLFFHCFPRQIPGNGFLSLRYVKKQNWGLLCRVDF